MGSCPVAGGAVACHLRVSAEIVTAAEILNAPDFFSVGMPAAHDNRRYVFALRQDVDDVKVLQIQSGP